MIIDEMTDLLVAAGFNNGWVLSGGKLVLWEHDENPPAPLIRPFANETLTS